MSGEMEMKKMSKEIHDLVADIDKLKSSIIPPTPQIGHMGREISVYTEVARKLYEENEKLKKEKDEIIEEYECYKSTTDSTIGDLQGEIEELKKGNL